MVVLFGDHLGHQIDYSIGLSSAKIGLVPTESLLLIFLAFRRNVGFLLRSLQRPDSLNVLRGQMSFPLVCSSSTTGHETAGSRLPFLPSVLTKILAFMEFSRVRGRGFPFIYELFLRERSDLNAVHHVPGVDTAGPPGLC